MQNEKNPTQTVKPKGKESSSFFGDVVVSTSASGGTLTIPEFPSPNPPLADGVAEMDVLSGRNKLNRRHTGNRYYQRLIARFLCFFEGARDKGDQNEVVNEVMEAIRQSGGRFLKWNTEKNQWIELTIERVNEKVSHALRDALYCKTGQRMNRHLRARQAGAPQGGISNPLSITASSSAILPRTDFSVSELSENETDSFCKCDLSCNNEEESDGDSDFIEHINSVLGPM
jgi:hypothetical protein